MDISENIRKAREGLRITQSELARKLNIEPTNYPRVEKRGNGITIEQLQKIADALGVGIGDLMGLGAGSMDKSPREVELEKRVLELEDRVKDKALIIEKLENEVFLMVRDISDGLVFQFVKCALDNKIIEAEFYEKYITVGYSGDGKVSSWYWLASHPKTRLSEDEDPSLLMSLRQMANTISMMDNRLKVDIFDAAAHGYLPESIANACEYYMDRMNKFGFYTD